MLENMYESAQSMYIGVQERNVNNMKLVRGYGNDFVDGKPLENDRVNTVYILDSNDLPFNRAELYHQFHDGELYLALQSRKSSCLFASPPPFPLTGRGSASNPVLSP